MTQKPPLQPYQTPSRIEIKSNPPPVEELLRPFNHYLPIRDQLQPIKPIIKNTWQKLRYIHKIGTLALYYDWLMHYTTSPTSRYYPPIESFFDVVLAKESFYMFIELHPFEHLLKRSEAQKVWFNTALAAGLPVFLWTDRDEQNVIEFLTTKEPSLELAQQLFPLKPYIFSSTEQETP